MLSTKSHTVCVQKIPGGQISAPVQNTWYDVASESKGARLHGFIFWQTNTGTLAKNIEARLEIDGIPFIGTIAADDAAYISMSNVRILHNTQEIYFSVDEEINLNSTPIDGKEIILAFRITSAPGTAQVIHWVADLSPLEAM